MERTLYSVVTEESAQTYSFNHAIVAAQVAVQSNQGFKFGGRVSFNWYLGLKRVSKKLVVITVVGLSGSELGSAYANQGSEVTVLKVLVLSMFDKDMVSLFEDNMARCY